MSKLAVVIEGRTYEIEFDLSTGRDGEMTVMVNGEPLQVVVPDLGGPLENIGWMIVNNRPYEIDFDRDLRWIKSYTGIHHLEIRDLEAMVLPPRSGDSRVKAPIPGLITRVVVKAGDQVGVGDPLVVLEAMKMENEIRAPRAGVVEAVHVETGQSITRGELMIEIG